MGAIGSSPGGGESLQRYDHTTKQVQLVNVWPEPYHDGNTAEVRFQWTYPIVFSPHDSNTLYDGRQQGVPNHRRGAQLGDHQP